VRNSPNKLSLLLLSILLSVFFSACAITDEPQIEVADIVADVDEDAFPVLNDRLFGKPVKIEQADEIFSLNEQQQKHFTAYFKSIRNIDKDKYEKVFQYLLDLSHEFKYSDSTLVAKDTLASKHGNCMSLAVLTASLAKFSGVDIEYQMVNRLPIYQEYGSIVFNAKHIRSVLTEPFDSDAEIQAIRGRAIVDYYPSRFNYVDGIIDENGFVAMYYRNRSAEELGKDNYQHSYYYLLESLKLEPDQEESINNLAVLHRRIGAEDKAEELYLYGIKKAKKKVSLLRNYRSLLQRQGRQDEARVIDEKLKVIDDENPFIWLHAANEAYDDSDYKGAIELYEKVLEKASYLHQAHFGIAKSKFMQGKFRAAEVALEKAMEEAFDENSKSIYEAKLHMLNKKPINVLK